MKTPVTGKFWPLRGVCLPRYGKFLLRMRSRTGLRSQFVPGVDNIHVRSRLTLRDDRERLFFELLRRFGVSGRKRSYQTLSVAARSSRRPFLFWLRAERSAVSPAK
jgi:hypothetical protein